MQFDHTPQPFDQRPAVLAGRFYNFAALFEFAIQRSDPGKQSDAFRNPEAF